MKKIIGILLITAFLFSLCACGAELQSNATLSDIRSIQSKTSSETTKNILVKADTRRGNILNCKSSITKSSKFTPGETYTGTAYYVSNSGNDNNSGLTPGAAWATIEHVNHAKLKNGDAVFFKRGSIWRGEYLFCQKGVTYSAYGEGAKPALYDSPENGAGANKWKLYCQGEHGEKIWKFYKNITDVGGVIFNEGSSYANRIYGWWTGDRYVLYENPDQPMNEKTCLEKDLDFCSMIDYTGCDFPIERFTLNLTGPLYLRCDKGNPGTIYKSIEFETKDTHGDGWYGTINSTDGCVVDNLCVRYYGDAGIHANPDAKNIIVQNCEVCWGGNCIHEYSRAKPTEDYMLSGDGIYGECCGAVIRNNYCHDIDCVGITFEPYPELPVTERGDYTCCGNLIERCGQGIWLRDDTNKIKLGNVTIDNNYILYAGYGYCHGGWSERMSLSFGGDIMDVQHISVTNNVLYLSKQYLFQCWSYEDLPMTMAGNVFVQNKNGILASWPRMNWEEWHMNDKGISSKVKNIMGDQSASLILAS